MNAGKGLATDEALASQFIVVKSYDHIFDALLAIRFSCVTRYNLILFKRVFCSSLLENRRRIRFLFEQYARQKKSEFD